MKYFNKIKTKDMLYSLIYGKGEVVYVLQKELRVDGFCMFEVKFECGTKIHYTEDGIPHWCKLSGCQQTIFFIKDIKFEEENILPIKNILPMKKVINLLNKDDTLLVKCPSGIWRHTDDVPEKIIMEAIKQNHNHLFKEKKIIKYIFN